MSSPNRIVRRAAHTLLAFCIAVACGSLALAQSETQSSTPPEGPPPGGQGQHGPSVEQRLKHLTKALTLNETQQAQVKEILTSEKAQMDALMSQSQPSDQNTGSEPPSQESMRAAHKQMRAIHEQTRASITAILDDTQKAKYAEMEQRRGSRNRQGGEMPPPPPDGGAPPGL
jgi:Spy/CpxP family protein refolding chaperone